MTFTFASPRSAPAMRWLAIRLGVAATLVALSDILIWRANVVGVALPLFLAALAAATYGLNPIRLPRAGRLAFALALTLALAALVEDVLLLSVLVALGSLTLFALFMHVGARPLWPRVALEAAVLPFSGPLRLFRDVRRARRLSSRRAKIVWRAASLLSWIAPLALGGIFLILFQSANPLIELWISQIDPSQFFSQISAGRVAFWLIVLGVTWPFAHLSARRLMRPAAPLCAAPAEKHLETVLGASAILRSLILLNALFALQLVLDAGVLSHGWSLPNGLSYAAYAHRGAYPLIVTALLAGAFTLIAMRRDGPAARARWIKPLVILWTCQNILLVAASIVRTQLYIEAYSLTGWRIAAIVWMILVGFGLGLILVKILRNRSNIWLLNANGLALYATLLACCFVNFPFEIAQYNLAHAQNFGGPGPALDMRYLTSLGPQALPALEAYPQLSATPAVRALRSKAERYDRGGWRGWTFRGWRLERYLSAPQVNLDKPIP